MAEDIDVVHFWQTFGDFLNNLDSALANIEQLTLFLLDNVADGSPPDEVQELFTAISNLQEDVTRQWNEVEELYE